MTKCWFDYKTVIITGASSGIGKDLTIKLIKDHGCFVIGVARNKQKLENLKEEIAHFGHKFTYYTFDVSVEENWKVFAENLQKDNIQPDIVINNAGVLPKFDSFEHYTIEQIKQAMDINFYSAVYSMNTLLPVVLKSETPAIINIASSAALCSLAGTCVYSASKAALKSFTDAVREEVRGKCYIGLVCPGFTKTDIFRNQGKSSSKSQKAMDLISCKCERMANLIINGIYRKRADMVFGVDAHFMDTGNKLFGVQCSRLCSKVMKLSGLEIFEGVFN